MFSGLLISAGEVHSHLGCTLNSTSLKFLMSSIMYSSRGRAGIARAADTPSSQFRSFTEVLPEKHHTAP